MSSRYKNTARQKVAPSALAAKTQATFQQALQLHQQGQLAQAQALYEEVLQSQPAHFDALHLSGVIAYQTKNFQKAAVLIGNAIEIQPDNAAMYFNRGNALRKLMQLNDAIACYDSAIVLNPDYAEAYNNRGIAFKELKQMDNAVTSYARAIALKPDYAEAHNNCGNALKELKQLDDAVASYDRAIELKPNFAEAYCNRGVALQELRQLDDAVASYNRAIALNPYYAEAYSNRGLALQELRQLDDAVASYDRAIELKPDYAEAYCNKSLALLLSGDFKNGWKLYKWRWNNKRLGLKQRNFPQPLWSGKESLTGQTILLHSEQGLGDTIQFCRYVTSVPDLCNRVILEVEPPLIGLLQDVVGLTLLVAKGSALPPFDYHCPLLNLPLTFKTNLDSIPFSEKYLRSSTDKLAYWKKRLGEQKKQRVGIVWSGNATHKNDHNRSILLADLIEKLPSHYQYVSLQKEVRDTDRSTLESNPTILHFGDELHDFTDTAALCELMDIVISVDTSVAHLSGAMGKKTWVLLPFSSDWRWLLNRDDSPWYKSVKLYRQPKIGDWESVLASVSGDLEKRIHGLPAGTISMQQERYNALTKQTQAKFQQALQLHQQGQLAQAKTLYEEILKLQPRHFDALHLSGVIAYQTKNPERAIEWIGKAIEIKPDNPFFYYNRGLALHELRLLDDAMTSYDRAIVLKPDYAEAYCNRGNTLRGLLLLEDAVTSCDHAIVLKPDYALAYNNRGIALQELKQLDNAIASYDKAIALKPDYAEAYCNRGIALQELKQLDNAVASYDKAIALKTDYAEPHCNRGNALQELKQLDNAIASYERAIALKPEYAEAYHNCGNALLELGKLDDAVTSYDRAIALKSDYAESYINRGFALRELRQLDDAIASYNQAIGLQSDYALAYWNKSLALLLNGDYKNGWELYEWRWKNETKRNFPQPLWSGKESLIGKTILLHSEQGYGDTIQFCRYARSVADICDRVLLEVQPQLTNLLKDVAGVAEVIAKGNELPPFDYHCPLLSLPLAFKTSLDSIPFSEKYLRSNESKLASWAGRLGEHHTLRVGIVWSGNAKHENDANRSIPLADLIGRLPSRCQYVSLQKEVRDTDQSTLESNTSILHFGDELHDFADTAALCELMDVVISVDTSVAHVSGAMGKETWVLLPFSPDWRWLLNRDDSPWYKSVKLYRQPKIGDWKSVLANVSRDLEKNTPRLTVKNISMQDTTDNALAAETQAKFRQALQLHQQGQLAQANALYEEVLQSQPAHFDALHLSGVIAYQTKNPERAIEWIGKAIEIKPDNAFFYYNRGLALHELRLLDDAMTSYDRAIVLKDDYAEAYCNRGNTLGELRQFDDAVASYDKAIALKPDYADAFYNRANALRELQLYEEAFASYENALALKPDSLFLLGTRLHTKIQICDWSMLDLHVSQLAEKIGRCEKVSPPFPILALKDSLSLQKEVARIFVQEKYPATHGFPTIPIPARHDKIRIGYYSADFHDHATAYLMAELFETHDRSQFELFAFSFGPKKNDRMRKRVTGAFDRFMDVQKQSDKEIAFLSRQLEIDIAIDLKGFTQDSRTGIFALRAAPIQVNYLGYPGTMGADYIDYLIADHTLIPEGSSKFYTEKIVFLPECYQVNDTRRSIADKMFTRKELGLPATGFVFCCFNNNYKITPITFDGWMRLLKQVEGSVLWLLEDNLKAASNLRQEATKRGVDAERLIFAQRMPLPEHLARHRQADLFLDTLPCNAHTTASDALWAGLPVLTCMGESFASRVAASLLNAIHLPELVTSTQDEYEALAIELATHPEKLNPIRQKLAQNLLTTPLFNTQLFTRHIEEAYRMMYERYQDGLPPNHLFIKPSTLPAMKYP